ncbi:MAG: hypothetical protein ABIZ49_05035 [Opitutaceae bacterium]
MNGELVGNRWRWLAAAAGAVVVVVVFALLMKVPEVPRTIAVKPVATESKARAAVDFGQTSATTEEAMLHDQRPLFLPTGRNASLGPVVAPEAGRNIFEEESLKPVLGGADLKLNLPAPIQLPDDITRAVLADVPPIPFYGFGRKLTKPPTPSVRGGFIEIVLASTQQRVLAEALPVEAQPKTEAQWSPIEFLAVVDAAGLVGPLTIVERSEVEEVDAHYRNYLAGTYRVGDRLAPGRYRIIVGP